MPDNFFFNIEFWKYLSIPVVAALVGWGTNWLAVKMTFYPVEPLGKPPFLGWQGIIPSKAAKMGAVTADSTLSRLGTLQELLNRMDPETIADHLVDSVEPRIEAYVEWVMLEESPHVWKAMPRVVKSMVYAMVREKLPLAIRAMMLDITRNIEAMVDIKDVVVKQLSKEKHIVNKIFLSCGAVEFKFIIRSGIYFGLCFGLIQMAVWYAFPAWWILPGFGFLVGFATNWIAIRIIFQPLNPIKLGPYVLQGIFLKRQKEVSEIWCDIVAREIITLHNIIEEMLHGKKSETTGKVIRRYIRDIIDEAVGITRPMVEFTMGIEQFAHIKDLASEKAVIFTSYAFDDPVFCEDRARVVKTLMQARMEQLSPKEFQHLLRPAFQEDEMKLIILGAILGCIAGFGQLFVIFGGI
ncbi:MAG: hypothetical protein KDH97_15075 [Calditrichaeota bacterium]|nr:hypothetical protein [Calditrichota bacterium]MCB0303464.1 hypothetical protein [Calditrichota bacterium]MCB0315230.1 hypothetical protein [Calditrichota bacterium]MCB9089475.1 hypothetical protein [Calditrichia bacterium]